MNRNFLLLIPIIMVMAGCEYSQFAQPEEPTAEHEHAFRLVPKQMNEQGAYKTTGGDSSPYSCLISTLADDDAEYNYWNQPFWVHFPQEVIDEAEGKTVFTAFSFSSEEAGEKAGSWHGQDHVVRVAQCVIPDSELAEALLEEQLRKFGKNTWLESRKEDMQSKQIATGGIEAASGEWVCTQLYTINVCQYNSDTNTYYNCMVLGPFCAEYVYENEDGDSGGGNNGGGDGGFPGDDPGECDPQGTEPCYNGPGGGSTLPPGIDPVLYNSLNSVEKSLCWQNPGQCFNVNAYALWAINWAELVEPDGQHNGPQDALRHAAWSGRITYEYNATIAETWTDAHEAFSTDPLETNMDQFNNAKGRDIGSSVTSLQQLIDEIIQAYENDELCTNLSDC